jgi:prepilin-type processing-associated H-X9-DG protein
MTSLVGMNISGQMVFAQEAESTMSDGCFAMYPYRSQAQGGPINSWWNLPANRHNKGENFSFADGHVEYWKFHDQDVANWQNGGPGGSGQDPTTGLGCGNGGFWPANAPYDDLYRLEAAAGPYIPYTGP